MAVDAKEYFRTSDTALAAFLMSEGFGKPDIEYNGSRAYFIFPRENLNIEQAISDWETARATTNAVLFFNAYQNLLRRIKEKY